MPVTHYRAAQYRTAGSIVTVDVPAATPGPDEVLVDVAYTGICGTDLHVWSGHMDQRVPPAITLGHEMSGRIAALGADVTDWAVGQAVTVLPLDRCGTCRACRNGHGNACQRLRFLGVDTGGAMRNQWLVPAQLLIALPDEVSLRAGALAEPTAVAVHDVHRSGLVAGDQALVVGGGPVGLLVALVARAAGADVLVVEPNPHRRQVADFLGLVALDADAETAAVVERWSGGDGVPIAFEVSGAQSGVDLALRSLGVRGRLVVVAIHAEAPRLDLHRVFWRELEILGARTYTPADFARAVELIAAGVVPADELISAVVPLDRADDAFGRLAAGADVVKVLVDCRADRDEVES